MTEDENVQDMRLAFKLLDSIVHGKRAGVFLSISKGDRTFKDLLSEVAMSKGGLSDALVHLSQSRMIASKPRDERILYELTPLGFFVRDQLVNCESLLSSFTMPKEKKILISFEDIVMLVEKTTDETLKNLFADGWTVILSSATYVRLTEYLDKRILEGSERAEEFENMLYENNLIQVVQMYSNPDKSIRVESYLRKQKKLKPEEAELVATAADQGAIIATNDDKVMLAGLEQGLNAIKLDKLNRFLDRQRSIISSHVSLDLQKERFHKSIGRQLAREFDLRPDKTNYKIAGSSSTWTYVQEPKEPSITL